MRAESKFLSLGKTFWANVRTVTEQVGYTDPVSKQVKVPTLNEIALALDRIRLSSSHIVSPLGNPTALGTTLLEYFQHRAKILNGHVEPRLMTAGRAKEVFDQLTKQFSPTCPIPMNKQTGSKKAPAYFTGIVNILVEAYSDGLGCDYDPQRLTTFTANGSPLRTLARRVDGAFPSTTNPIALWEIKEYYYTTTFGSRIADGVYETLLDGMELEELETSEKVAVEHIMFIDAYDTWWLMGKSYLCRIIDMLHMGYVDEVIFGHEVVERLPDIMKTLVARARATPSVA